MLKKIFLLALSLILIACSSERIETTPPPTPNEFSLDQNYHIGVGDELQVQVWRNPELSIHVPVRPDGKISTPLVGDVVAAGLSANELAATLIQKLNNYVRNPEVTVVVTNPVSADFLRRVRITGSVRNPTSTTYRQGMTVLDIVLLAGGVTEFAAPDNARLYRTIDGQTKVYKVDLKAILNNGDLKTNYPLYPSDVVTVPERSF